MTQSDPLLDRPADGAAVALNGDGPLPAIGGTPTVRQVAARGAAWTVLGYASLLILRFGFNLLLTRLVAPKVFGVMAIINLLIQSLHMFSDLGISQCVTRHERGDDPHFLNTAWTVQVFRGLGLWLVSVALAGPAAWFYEEPALAWLIPIAATAAIMDGLQSTAIFTLNRRLSRGRLVLLELMPYAAAMVVAIGAIAAVAHRHPGGIDDLGVQHAQVLILVGANVAIFAIRAAVSYRLIRGRRHKFGLEPTAARELLHFGGWVFVSTACGFLATQADQLVIGKFSLETLGVYRVASQLAVLPAQFVAALCAQLVFPLYSRMFRDDSGAGVAGIHRTLGLLAGWLVCGLLVAGPTFIECLYRDKYQNAAGYIRLLAAAAWFTMLQSTGEAVLLAHGKARLMAVGQVIKLIALVPLMALGYWWGDLIGLVIGYGLAEVVRYVAIAMAVRSLGQPLALDDLWLTSLIAATAAGVIWLGPATWGGAPPWARLGLEALSVTCIWAAVLGTLWRRGRLGIV
jgi:O-antigen/teichoic acid export membrane protein